MVTAGGPEPDGCMQEAAASVAAAQTCACANDMHACSVLPSIATQRAVLEQACSATVLPSIATQRAMLELSDSVIGARVTA